MEGAPRGTCGLRYTGPTLTYLFPSGYRRFCPEHSNHTRKYQPAYMIDPCATPASRCREGKAACEAYWAADATGAVKGCPAGTGYFFFFFLTRDSFMLLVAGLGQPANVLGGYALTPSPSPLFLAPQFETPWHAPIKQVALMHPCKRSTSSTNRQRCLINLHVFDLVHCYGSPLPLLFGRGCGDV